MRAAPRTTTRVRSASLCARALRVVVILATGCGARTALDEPASAAMDAGTRRDAGRDASLGLDAAPDAPGLDAGPRRDAGLDASDARDAPSRDAPPDVPAPDAGDPCDTDPGPLRAPLCTRPLFAEDAVLSCPGGFVDVVAQGPGTLLWECDGTRIEARFGDRVYRGSRSGDFVALCIQTEFDYADGCRWRSSQRLEGDVTTGELALGYREVAIAGTACFPPCSADARVRLP